MPREAAGTAGSRGLECVPYSSVFLALKVQPVGPSWQDANGRKEGQPARE